MGMKALRLRYLPVLLAAFVVLAACGKTAGEMPRPTAIPDNVTLKLWIPESQGTGRFFPEVVEAYERANPGVNVEIVEFPTAEYPTRLAREIYSENGPDVALVSDPSWLRQGMFLPLNEAVKNTRLPLSELNQGALRSSCMVDETLYCLGTRLQETVLLYNRALFDQAGLPYPPASQPLSMKEYSDLALKLAKPGDALDTTVWGGAASLPLDWMDTRKSFGDDGKQVKKHLNDDATIAAYQLLADIYSAGAAPSQQDLSALQSSLAGLFAQGKLATLIADQNSVIPKAEAAGVDWGAAVVPVEQKGDPAWTTSITDGYGVAATGRHAEAATRLVLFLGRDGSALRQGQGEMPLNNRLAEQWAAGNEARSQLYQAAQVTGEHLFVPEEALLTHPLREGWTRILDDGIAAVDVLTRSRPACSRPLTQPGWHISSRPPSRLSRAGWKNPPKPLRNHSFSQGWPPEPIPAGAARTGSPG